MAMWLGAGALAAGAAGSGVRPPPVSIAKPAARAAVSRTAYRNFRSGEKARNVGWPVSAATTGADRAPVVSSSRTA